MDSVNMMSPEKVAAEYSGDKKKIGQAVQMGLLDPTVGVMAGMFIDRVRAAAVKEQQPDVTVAQETLGPAGLGATQVAQQMAPQMTPASQPAMPAQPPAQAPMMAASGGLMDLPVPEDMVPDEYAGGGIVAFSAGDLVDPVFAAPGEDTGSRPLPYESFTGDMTLQELQEYYRSGKVPDRLKGREPRGLGSRGAPLLGDYTGYKTPRGAPVQKEDAKKEEPPTRSQSPVPDTRKNDTEAAGPGAAPAAAQTDYAAMVENLKKRFGVTDDSDAKAREAISQYRSRLTQDIDKAGALGMIQAGLGIAGGKSRYALQNLAGAAPAIAEYARAQEKIRGEERGLLDSEIKLDQAAEARRRGDMATALKLEQDAKELAIRERQVKAAERQAGRAGAQTEYVATYAKSKGISFDQAAREIAEMQGEARNPLNAYIAEQIRSKGKTGQININDLLEKHPGVVPTR